MFDAADDVLIMSGEQPIGDNAALPYAARRGAVIARQRAKEHTIDSYFSVRFVLLSLAQLISCVTMLRL